MKHARLLAVGLFLALFAISQAALAASTGIAGEAAQGSANSWWPEVIPWGPNRPSTGPLGWGFWNVAHMGLLAPRPFGSPVLTGTMPTSRTVPPGRNYMPGIPRGLSLGLNHIPGTPQGLSIGPIHTPGTPQGPKDRQEPESSTSGDVGQTPEPPSHGRGRRMRP
jgi:hypothetical protein